MEHHKVKHKHTLDKISANFLNIRSEKYDIRIVTSSINTAVIGFVFVRVLDDQNVSPFLHLKLFFIPFLSYSVYIYIIYIFLYLFIPFSSERQKFNSVYGVSLSTVIILNNVIARHKGFRKKIRNTSTYNTTLMDIYKTNKVMMKKQAMLKIGPKHNSY